MSSLAEKAAAVDAVRAIPTRAQPVGANRLPAHFLAARANLTIVPRPNTCA